MHQYDQYFRENYLTVTIREMARVTKKSRCYINGRFEKLKLIVPDDIRQKRISDSNFKKGSVPVTKGKKQSEYMTPEAIERTKATRFKTGNLPHNTKYDGHISTRKDADGRLYLWIRKSMSNWIHLHRHIWEQEHGPVPEGYVVYFIDGDRFNCVLDNLGLMTMADNLNRNSAQFFMIRKALFLERLNVKGISKRLKQLKREQARQYREYQKQQLKHQRKLSREERKKKLLQAKKAAKIQVHDHGPVKLNTNSLFHQSMDKYSVEIFSYAAGLTRSKEYGKDLIHDIVARFDDGQTKTLQELKKMIYQVYSEELKIQRHQNKNEKIFLFLSNEEREFQDDLKTDVLQAISSLNVKEQKIANCILLSEMTIEETIEKTGMSSGDIQILLSDITVKLQNKLIKYSKN